MAPLEPAHALLLLIQSNLRLGKLSFQEFRSPGRLPLACLRIFLAVEGRESVRDVRHGCRIASLVADAEGHRRLTQAAQLRALDLALDVRTHAGNDGFQRHLLPWLDIQA